MGRAPKPWYHERDDAWYTKIHGRQFKLASGKSNEAKAKQACIKLRKDHVVILSGDSEPAERICRLYVKQLKLTPETNRLYRYFLKSFCAKYGRVAVFKLKRAHATHWMDAHPWNESSRAYAASVLKRCFRWAQEEEIVSRNPFSLLRKGSGLRRERTLSSWEQMCLLAQSNQPFTDFLYALFQTGARPGELRKLTVDMVKLKDGCWSLDEHKTKKKTQAPRMIWLSPDMIEFSKKLIASAKEKGSSFLFRNFRGGPWSKESVVQRMNFLRIDLGLGKDVVLYSARHTYLTNALQHLDVATVATLAGHKGVGTLMSNYSHLIKQAGYMRDAATKARPR